MHAILTLNLELKMNPFASQLSRSLAAAVVTAAALTGCANTGCCARCNVAAGACGGKKCGACGVKKCGACAAKKCGACGAKK